MGSFTIHMRRRTFKKKKPGMKSQEERKAASVGVEDTFSSRVLLLCAAVCQCVAGEDQLATTGMYSPKHSAVNKVASRTINAKKKARKRSSASESSAGDAAGVLSVVAPYGLRQRIRRYRAMSACEYVENYLNNGTEGLTSLVETPFPFANLPTDCKLKVLSMLSMVERGRAAQVCKEWNQLVKTPSIWHTVDFTEFPLCHSKMPGHECSKLCYSKYKTKMKMFFQSLMEIKPVVRQLRFAFDIANYEDSWLELLTSFLRAARCKDLEFASLNWKETPMRPFAIDHLTWSNEDYQEFMHKFKHRQRKFISFFEQFTALAPNVTQMILPFDWSPRSLACLRRLPNLRSVVLEKYFVFQPLKQESLDCLFVCAPNLEQLLLEVWTPSGQGLRLYNLSSSVLRYLDISQCRGFYLEQMTLPKLRVFKVTRHPWNGPLTCRDSVHIPCLYTVLKEGAPKIEQINEHMLHDGWRDSMYPELETVLKSVCSCKIHKTGWAL